MFTRNQSLHRSKLAALKTGSSANAVLYAGLLETPRGSQFEANVGDSDTLKRLAYLGATVGEPGSLVEPLYEPTSSTGPSGQGNSPPPVSVQQGAGLNCLPAGVDGARLTLRNKLLVLNCLIFDTPHSFWVKGSASSREAKQLKREIDSSTGRYAWLKRGDWMCSPKYIGVQGPVPSCLKHDVAYASLQKFAGDDADARLANEPDGDELDEAWNPRNKALADEKLRADIRRYGCQDQSGFRAAILCGFPKEDIAEVFHFGVSNVNHKGWPITNADLSDFRSNYNFKVCDEPVVPSINGLTASRSGRTITASWDFEPGCVPIGISDVLFEVNWSVQNSPIGLSYITDPNSCTVNGGSVTCAFVINHNQVLPGNSITAVSVFVVPRDRIFALGAYGYGGVGNTGRRFTVNVGPFKF